MLSLRFTLASGRLANAKESRLLANKRLQPTPLCGAAEPQSVGRPSTYEVNVSDADAGAVLESPLR